jgi:hypothetical protein
MREIRPSGVTRGKEPTSFPTLPAMLELSVRINRWLLFGFLLACTVGVALIALAWLPRPGINKQNFDRIEVGMTQAEVEAIFGGPPTWKPVGNRAEWANDGAYDCATIDFDEDGRVMRTAWQDLDERTPFEKFLDRLPWREKPRFSVVVCPDPLFVEQIKVTE